MAGKVTKLTPDALEKKQKELEDLKVNQRKQVAIELQEARAQGDLSENAEYDAAREKKAEIEAKIAELEELLDNYELVEMDELPTDEVNMGSIVTIYDEEEDEELVFTIVSTTETNSLEGKISLESPMGKALNKKKVGDSVEVMGLFYEIRKVER